MRRRESSYFPAAPSYLIRLPRMPKWPEMRIKLLSVVHAKVQGTPVFTHYCTRFIDALGGCTGRYYTGESACNAELMHDGADHQQRGARAAAALCTLTSFLGRDLHLRRSACVSPVGWVNDLGDLHASVITHVCPADAFGISMQIPGRR